MSGRERSGSLPAGVPLALVLEHTNYWEESLGREK